MTTKFGVSLQSAWEAVKRVVKVLCNLRSYFIKWPSQQECNETSERVRAMWHFPGVIGSVDGTHIRISAPNDQPDAYINRKGFHSLQLQVSFSSRGAAARSRLESVYAAHARGA